ncbi:thioredoxin domain protein [Enterobacter phage vB_VIPECLUMC02]|nr:thioredoxin domain protein [Enterobacter phage vB_VIPECLUMC02]
MTFKVFGYDSKHFKCVPCINSKRLLDAKRKDYEFISVTSGNNEDGTPIFNEEVISELLVRLNRPSRVGLTMPQIFDEKGSPIGGFTELKEYLK